MSPKIDGRRHSTLYISGRRTTKFPATQYQYLLRSIAELTGRAAVFGNVANVLAAIEQGACLMQPVFAPVTLDPRLLLGTIYGIHHETQDR